MNHIVAGALGIGIGYYMFKHDKGLIKSAGMGGLVGLGAEVYLMLFGFGLPTLSNMENGVNAAAGGGSGGGLDSWVKYQRLMNPWMLGAEAVKNPGDIKDTFSSIGNSIGDVFHF